MSNYFSTNLKFIRESKGLSQNKLANLVGVNQTTIARWETEEIAPSIDNVEELAKVLNVDLAEILGNDMGKKDNYNELDQVLFSKAKELSDEDKRLILNVMESINKGIDAQDNK